MTPRTNQNKPPNPHLWFRICISNPTDVLHYHKGLNCDITHHRKAWFLGQLLWKRQPIISNPCYSLRRAEKITYPNVCFIQFSSSLFCKTRETYLTTQKSTMKGNTLTSKETRLTVKSSRACAPLLSFLASAEYIVIQAFIKRFSNSIVSIKSEFL